MDYQALVTDLLETTLVIGLPVLTGYAVKWLNVHIGTKRTELIKSEIQTVVRSIEQQAAAGKIDKDNKFYTAFQYVTTHYKDLTEDKVTHLIEAAVRDMKLNPVEAAVVTGAASIVKGVLTPETPAPVTPDVTIQTPTV